MKKPIILSVSVATITILTALAVYTAPYMVSLTGRLTFDKWHIISYASEGMLVYNWLLGFVMLTLCAIAFFLFRRKESRIIAIIPASIAASLLIAMFYVGLCVSYEGDGFTCVKRPFSKKYEYRNSKNEVIIITSNWLKKEYDSADSIIFRDIEFPGINVLYDGNGVCFLHRPSDDKRMKAYHDFYYSEKSYSKDGYFDHCRVRFFDRKGKYLVTRVYGLGGYRPDGESGELLSEYKEDVTELPDGTKTFKITK